MKARLFLLLPCVAVLSGCISTTVPDTFRLDEAAEKGLRKTNWKVAKVNVAGHPAGQDLSICNSVNERLREMSDPTLASVPVSVEVSVKRKSEDYNWTYWPCLFTAGIFPAITDTTFHYTLSLRTSADAWKVSSTVTQSLWGSWLSIPATLVYAIPRGEPLELEDIASEAILAQLTPERYERTIRLLAERREAERLAEERARRAAEERRLAEEKARREEEERRLAEEKARREEEERARREAEERRLAEEKARREAKERRLAEEQARREEKERARKESEARWLSRKDDPDFKFPLHGLFPKPIKLYGDFESGCSIDWARDCIEHSAFSADGGAAPFHFRDGNRTVDLHFETVRAANGACFTVLVGATIQFDGTGLSVEDLAEKYRKAFPDAAVSQENKTETDFGVSAAVRVATVRSAAVEIEIRDVVSVSRKDEKHPTATDAAMEKASSAGLYEAEAAAGMVMLAMAIDMKVDERNAERRLENYLAWRSKIGKLEVSVTDATIAKVVSDAAEERRRAEEAEAERVRNAERDRLLDSF